jgi:hypothetical protein
MFGIGKLFGGFLNKIGLGFLSPFVSLAVNFFSGNYLALIGDISNLVGKFSKSSFLKNMSLLNPLGNFSQKTSVLGNLFSGNKLGILRNSAQFLGLNKAENMLAVVAEFRSSYNLVQQNRENAHYYYLR